MKPISAKKQKTFDDSYKKIMKSMPEQEFFQYKLNQWQSPSDSIVKFSLYQETPRSVTSTNTTANLGVS